MNFTSKKTVIALALLGLSTTCAHAALHDRGNGLIYDDVLDVTWLSDPNYITSSGFAPSYFGLIHWETAMRFAEQLEYEGFDDWRLPRFTYLDNNADGTPDCRVAHVRYCNSENHFSELEFMFKTNLKNIAPLSIEAVNNSYIDGTTGEIKYIRNLKEGWLPQSEVDIFWHETEFKAPGLSDPRAWTYDFGSNVITHLRSEDNIPGWGVHAWLVRDGDVLGTQALNERIEGGVNHSLVLKSNGELWGWGANFLRQLGTTSLPTTVQTPNLLDHNNTYTSISAGHDHSLAIKEDGTVLGWGSTKDGRLGNYSATFVSTPAEVGINEVKQVEAGFYHSMALKQNGTVWVWGKNDKGQLGHKQSSSSKVPAQITDLTDIKFVDSGLQSSFALTNDGQIWSWGRNTYGQLGRVTQNDEHIPAVITGLNNIKALAAGYLHTLALDAEGSVWSFGQNMSYQTGYPRQLYIQKTPYKIPSLTGIVSVAAGFNYSLALKSDGTVWSWGGNSAGQLGLGYTSTSESVPVQIPNIDNAVAIEAHHTTTFILLKTGELLAFGRNSTYSVGNGSNQTVTSPTQVLSDVLN